MEYNQRYNIQLDDVTALDWFGDDPERVLDQYDNILIVGTIKETHHGSMGSEALMKALGGKAVTDSYEACEVILTTTCVAPDDTTAQRIYDEILAGMRETPGENYDYENNGYVEAVHILLDAPEAIKGEYQQFEMKRSGRNFTFISTLADPDYVTYLRSQGFTNLHHQVKQIPDWGNQ